MILVHKHLIIRALINNPPTSQKFVEEEWLPNLVKDIGMNILKGPFSAYSYMVGNKGLTAGTIIETSHIMMHVWDEDSPALLQLDVYTCGPLDPVIVANSLAEFDPILVEMKYLDRENGLVEIPLITEDDIV